MKKGFTLIELLVVISIIGVLSTLGLVSYRNALVSARDGVRKQDVNQLATALEIYYQKNGHYVKIERLGETETCSGDIATFYKEIGPYMAANKVPKDPQTQAGYCYISQNDGASYRLFAKLENCKDDPDTIPNLTNCQTAQYNYSKVSEDLFIAAAPEDIDLVASPPPASPPPPPSPPPSSVPVAFKHVFVTSTLYKGNLGGLAGADQKCQARADAANLGGSWKAWLSSNVSIISAKDRVSDAEYQRMDNTIVANDKTDLLDGTLDNPIDKTESGEMIDAMVWTGTQTNGTFSNETCAGWTNSDVAEQGNYGSSSRTDGGWTFSEQRPHCYTTLRLYCFEQ